MREPARATEPVTPGCLCVGAVRHCHRASARRRAPPPGAQMLARSRPARGLSTVRPSLPPYTPPPTSGGPPCVVRTPRFDPTRLNCSVLCRRAAADSARLRRRRADRRKSCCRRASDRAFASATWRPPGGYSSTFYAMTTKRLVGYLPRVSCLSARSTSLFVVGSIFLSVFDAR